MSIIPYISSQWTFCRWAKQILVEKKLHFLNFFQAVVPYLECFLVFFCLWKFKCYIMLTRLQIIFISSFFFRFFPPFLNFFPQFLPTAFISVFNSSLPHYGCISIPVLIMWPWKSQYTSLTISFLVFKLRHCKKPFNS